MLEGISGLNFPVASELCTRFATQIVFRRSRKEEHPVKVSIIPATKSSEEHREKLAEFQENLPELCSDDFKRILEDVRHSASLSISV